MNCLDCFDSNQLAVPAVAVCSGCGAAVCREHLIVRQHQLHRTGLMGAQHPVDPPARITRCHTCDVAAHAHTDPAYGPVVRTGTHERERR